MNLDQLRAALTRNKVAIGAAGAAGVGLLALRARSRSGSTSTTSSAGTASQGVDVAPTYAGSTGYSAGSQTGTYDSSAVDVYNALQPELEALRARMDENADPPIPVPEDPYATRRNTIVDYYKTILGRTPGTSEVNAWDGTGGSLDQIRNGILGSPEAKKVT